MKTIPNHVVRWNIHKNKANKSKPCGKCKAFDLIGDNYIFSNKHCNITINLDSLLMLENI